MRSLFWKLGVVGILAMGTVSCGSSDDDDGGTQQETTVPTPELGLAENLTATVEADPLRVLLSWEFAGSQTVEFAVYRAETAAELAVQNLTAARLLTTTEDVFYEDKDVTAGSTYYYRVRTVDGQTFGRASQLISVEIAADGTATVVVVEAPQPDPGDGDDRQVCRDDQVRVGGVCQCPTGQIEDGGQCVPDTGACPDGQVENEEGNCVCLDGSEPVDDVCPLVCREDQVIVEGQCVCPEGTTDNGDACVEDTICRPDQIEEGGVCVCPDGTSEVNESCVPDEAVAT